MSMKAKRIEKLGNGIEAKRVERVRKIKNPSPLDLAFEVWDSTARNLVEYLPHELQGKIISWLNYGSHKLLAEPEALSDEENIAFDEIAKTSRLYLLSMIAMVEHGESLEGVDVAVFRDLVAELVRNNTPDLGRTVSDVCLFHPEIDWRELVELLKADGYGVAGPGPNSTNRFGRFDLQVEYFYSQWVAHLARLWPVDWLRDYFLDYDKIAEGLENGG
jgi:hypothetical protein